MQAIKRILVVIDPTSREQPAFEAALALGKTFGARLDLFACEYREAHARYHPVELSTVQHFHDSILANLNKTVDEFAATVREANLEVGTEVVWAAPYYEEVTARARRLKPDLVVKATQYHSRIRRTLFTGSDWHLIRDCPSALLLVKQPSWPAAPTVLVCVDPLHVHAKPAALDEQMLDTGQLLASRFGGELHVLHVYAMPGPMEVLGDAASIAAMETPGEDEQTVERARKALAELAARHEIPAARLHFRIGRPAHDIIEAAADLEAAFVVMGAVARRRLERLFVGSTAEEVLDALPCNVLVEKPLR